MNNPKLFDQILKLRGCPTTEITLRDLFAMAALIAQRDEGEYTASHVKRAALAYADADAMLVARVKP